MAARPVQGGASAPSDRLRPIDWIGLALFLSPLAVARRTAWREGFDMACRPHEFARTSALPLAAALAIIPSLPRPMLSRLVARAIERLDEQDGDPDLELDDHAEDDDPGEDNGDRELEEGRVPARDAYGLDQREMKHWGGCFRID